MPFVLLMVWQDASGIGPGLLSANNTHFINSYNKWRYLFILPTAGMHKYMHDTSAMLHGVQASGNERQMSLLKCLIHSMYDEIRFLHDYPDHELDRTARLLGAVICNR